MSKVGRFWFGMLLAVGAMYIALYDHACAEDMITCRIGLARYPVTRHRCDILTAGADALRAGLTNSPPDYPTVYIFDGCIKGMEASEPGYEYSTYHNTCLDLMRAVLQAPR